MLKEILFKGHPTPNSLSNEKELVKHCPQEFKQNNFWSNFAARFFFLKIGGVANWIWKTDDIIIRTNQLACFCGLVRTLELSIEDKKAVAGWMLSEMLFSVPA